MTNWPLGAPEEPIDAYQFRLRSLFHLVGLAAAASLAAAGVRTGAASKVIFPLLALGGCYTVIVGYRIRKTIARFPWDVGIFAGCWLFLTYYVTVLVWYLNLLLYKSTLPIPNSGERLLGFVVIFAVIAVVVARQIVMIYWRAKHEPEDDFC